MKLVFTYDYMGRRVRKQVYSYSAGAWNSTPTTDRKFVYDGWNLLLELNGLSSDAVLRKYTWGLDLSGQGGNPSPGGVHGAGGIGGLLSMRDVGSSTNHWYFYNANGDIGQLVDSSSGNFSAKYQYYPYGGEIQATGTYATVNPFRFSTKIWDGEHEAYYYGYRYHKPKLGRWLSRDPIGELGGHNLYRVVNNLPTNLVDPLGQKPDFGCNCCCVRASWILDKEDIGVGGQPKLGGYPPIGNKFTLQVLLLWHPVTAGESPGDCTFEWWEWTDVKNTTNFNQPTNQWWPGHLDPNARKTSPVFDDFRKRNNKPIDPSRLELLRATDRPLMSGVKDPTRTLHIAVKAKSAPKCNCAIKEISYRMTQKIQVTGNGAMPLMYYETGGFDVGDPTGF